MTRKRAVQVDNQFIKGLITETTALNFPENACTEAWNCVFDETGRISRRRGFYNTPTTTSTLSAEANSDWAYTEYLWQNPGGVGTASFHVEQQGRYIRVYDVSSTTDNLLTLLNTFDLETYKPTNSGAVTALHPCQYAENNGFLMIVSEYTNPFYITSTNGALTATVVKPVVRDVIGLDSGIADNARPTESISSLKTNNPSHAYNLYNQGWAQTDALTQWDTARTDMPANSDFIALYRSSATDAFDNALVTSRSDGNSAVARGHYKIEPAFPDRVTALLEDGITGVALAGPTATLGNIGTYFHGGNGNIGSGDNQTGGWNGTGTDNSANRFNFPFDNNDNSYLIDYVGGSTRVATFGKDLLTGYRFSSFSIKGHSSIGFFNDGYSGNVVITVRGSNTMPTSATSGTSLGTTTVGDTASAQTINSTDTTNTYRYIWVNINAATSPGNELNLARFDAVVFSSTSSFVATDKRYKACASYAGRMWYAGLDDFNLNGSILFSRIIQKPSEFAICYTANDPTSEINSDLLPDDGGVVRIPEIGSVIKLFAYQSSLLIFATNGVWRIFGGGGFTANAYTVARISSTGTNCAVSFINYKGLPLWWGEDGIYTVKYDANYDSFAVTSLTDSTIKSFLDTIGRENKKYVKGAYDIEGDTIVWLYNSSTNLAVGSHYKYDRALCMNGLSQAFYPWTLYQPSTNYIQGISYIIPGLRNSDSIMKFRYVAGTTQSYLDQSQDLYTDTGPVDYDSYFITGYKIHGETEKFSQMNYVFLFLDVKADSSCYAQGIYDYTINTDSNRWGNMQQIYSSNNLNRSVAVRRLKVRGKGRALQLRFEGDGDAPFSIIGWSINESVNGDI